MQVSELRERVTCRSKVVTGTAAVSRASRATRVSSAKDFSSTTTTSSAPTATAPSKPPTPAGTLVRNHLHRLNYHFAHVISN